MKCLIENINHIITATLYKNSIKKDAYTTRTHHQYIARIGNCIITQFFSGATPKYLYVIFYYRGCNHYENNDLL